MIVSFAFLHLIWPGEAVTPAVSAEANGETRLSHIASGIYLESLARQMFAKLTVIVSGCPATLLNFF